MGQCASLGAGSDDGVLSTRPPQSRRSQGQATSKSASESSYAPCHCILLASPPLQPAHGSHQLQQLQFHPGTFWVGPDGQVCLGGWEQRKGAGGLGSYYSLTVVNLSEQCKLALSVGSEAEYVRTLVEWCNCGDAGLGVVLRAIARLASLPCLPGSSQSMSVCSSVPWPRPVLMVERNQSTDSHQKQQGMGLTTIARSLPCDDSSVLLDREGYPQPSSFIMLEHRLGPCLDPAASNSLRSIARSIPLQQQLPWETPALSQPAPLQQLHGNSNFVLPPDYMRSMIVAAEAPAMLTLITEQGLVLYQNDLSIEYYGNVVSAAAAVARFSQSGIPSVADKANTSMQVSSRLNAANARLSHESHSSRASPGGSDRGGASQPGLRLLMALFRLQEKEDREEEEEEETDEMDTVEEEELEDEEIIVEDEREGVGGDGSGSNQRRGRRRKKDVALEDIHNHRLLLEMLDTVIEQGMTWNRTMKVPLALDTLSHQLFPSACHHHLLASRANISEVQFQQERMSEGQHLFSNTCTTLPGSPTTLEQQQALGDLNSTLPGHERELMMSHSFSRTTSNLPDTIIPWAHPPAFGPATTPCFETVTSSTGAGKARGSSREDLEVAASGRSFVGGGRARGVGGHAEGLHTLFPGRKSSQWRRASALLPHSEGGEGHRQEAPRSKSFTHLKHPQLWGNRRSAGGLAPSDPSSHDSSTGLCHGSLPRAQHSSQSMTVPAIPTNGSFTLSTHPNLQASTSGLHQQQSQSHQTVRGPLPHAQVEHLQHVSRMSFSGPMRRPSSMTRAMVEKMMAHSQHQPGNRGPTSLQQQVALSSSKHHEALPYHTSQCSSRTPSTLGWAPGTVNGLREINSLWEVAAQQGSSVSQTANAVGGVSGRLCNTVTAPTVADGSSLLNAPPTRSATEEAPTLGRKDSRGAYEDHDRASGFLLMGGSPPPSRSQPQPHQPQFSSRHADQRPHTLRSMRNSSQNSSQRISMSAGANAIAVAPPSSAPNLSHTPFGNGGNGGGRTSPDAHLQLASLASSQPSSSAFSGRHSVNAEPSYASNIPSHSNLASYATSALLSSHSRTSHLLRVNRHASSSALNQSPAGGLATASGVAPTHGPPLTTSTSYNRRSLNPSSFEGLVRSQSVLPSMQPSAVLPTHSSPLPKHPHPQQSHPVQHSEHHHHHHFHHHHNHQQQQQQQQPPQPPPPPQQQQQNLPSSPHQQPLLPKQQPPHLLHKPHPLQQLHHSNSRTSMSVAGPTPATANSGSFASGHHASSSLLLPKAGGRVRAALNALEGSHASHTNHASNAGGGAPRRPPSQGPRRSISTSYLGGSMWGNATYAGPPSDPPAQQRWRISQSPCNTPEAHSAALPPQHSAPTSHIRLPGTVTSPSLPSAAALGIHDRPHTCPLQQQRSVQTDTISEQPLNSDDLGRVLQWQQDKLLESLIKDSEAQEDDNAQDVTEVTEAFTTEEPSSEACKAQQQQHHHSLDEPPPPVQPKPHSLRQQAAATAAAAAAAPAGPTSSWALGGITAGQQQQQQQQQLRQSASQRIVKFSKEPQLLHAEEEEGRGSSITSSSSSNRDHDPSREVPAAVVCETGACRDAARGDGQHGRDEEEEGREFVEYEGGEYEDEGMVAEEEGRQIDWCWHEVVAKRCVDPVTGSAAVLLVQRNITERAQLENSLSELTEAQLAMMSQIFPRHVIEALSMGNKEDLDIELVAKMARSHAHVTVLFMDLVGFTSMSKEIPPEEVIIFLNCLFGYFDRLVEKHRVQKIDTVGDAYLVASGILTPDDEGFNAVDESHNPERGAHRVLAFAQDMLRVSRLVLMPHSSNPVSIRIGIHTGPCVSGLIGTKLPKWTVLGGTINTAARAEQTCRPDHVQVTEATHKLLPPGKKELLEPTGGVFCKGLGMLDTYLWSPPSSWADETDLPSDFFDLLTPSTASRSSSRRSSNSDELHELPERRDELGLPTVSAFNSSVASLLAEGISEEGEEVLGSGSDPSVSMGEELQPHLSLCLSHRDSQKEGAATDSRDRPSKANMCARHSSSGGSSTNFLPAGAQSVGGSRRMRESRLSSTNGAVHTHSSAPNDSHVRLPLPPVAKASGLPSSQSLGAGRGIDPMLEEPAPVPRYPFGRLHSRSNDELMALEGSSKQAASAATRVQEGHTSKPASTGQMTCLDGLASLPSLQSLGGSGREGFEGSGRMGTRASCTGSSSKGSSSLVAGYGTGSRRLTDSNTPTVALLKAGSARERFGSSSGGAGPSSFSPALSSERAALPPVSLAERVARARGASSMGQHAGMAGDANARNNMCPTPPASPPVHSISQQMDRPLPQQQQQQQQQRTGANAAGAAFVKLFRRPPGRSTSFVIPPLKDKPQRPSDLVHLSPLQPAGIHRTSSEQQLSRHAGNANSFGKDGGAGSNSLSPRPSSASFSHTPLSRASQNSVQHSPVRGNSASQQPALLEQLEEEQPALNESTADAEAPSLTSLPKASVAVAAAPGKRAVSAPGLSTMQEEQAASEEEAASAGTTGYRCSPLHPPGADLEEAPVPAMPRKGLHARAAAAPLQQRQGGARSPSSPSGKSRSTSANLQQQQQQQPPLLYEQQVLALSRAGTGGSDSVVSFGGGGPAGAASAGGSGDGTGGDRLHARFARTGSGMPQAPLPHVNFQGLNALRAMGVACRRRSSLWSCGSNEETTRHSPQATGVLPRVMSERVPAEAHAARMGIGRRGSVAVTNQAEQTEVPSPLPHAAPRRARRASLDLGAATLAPNLPTLGQPQRHPAAPSHSSNRSTADPFNLASPAAGMSTARGGRARRASMDLSAFAVPLQHLAQASSMVAHNSHPPPAPPTQARFPATYRGSMDLGATALRPYATTPPSHSRTLPPAFPSTAGLGSTGSANKGQRRSVDFGSAYVSPLQHTTSGLARSSNNSRRSIGSAAAAAAGLDMPRLSQVWNDAGQPQPHPQPLSTPVAPARRWPTSVPQDQQQQQQQQQQQHPPTPHSHPSRRSQRRGSIDMGVLSNLASAAMQTHLASQQAHPHAPSSSSFQQQQHPHPPSSSELPTHCNNLAGLVNLPSQHNSSADQLPYFPCPSSMHRSPFCGPQQAGVVAPTQGSSQLLQQQPLQEGATSAAAGFRRGSHRKSSNCSSTSTGVVDNQGDLVAPAAAAAAAAPTVAYQGPVRSQRSPTRMNSRGPPLRGSCTNPELGIPSAAPQGEMVHNADVATDGALPDKEDRDVCGAFPMRKANATGAGIGSRRVSIALENSTERSWRESSQGSSVPRRSMSNLQPTQQSRSRRASRVSGEGSNQPQATGAGKKRSSSGTIEGHDCDGSRPSSGKAGVASIFGSLVQVSNRHMLRLLPGHKERSLGNSSGSGGGTSAGASPALTLMASPTFQRRMSLGGSRRPLSDTSCDGEGDREEGSHPGRPSGAGEGKEGGSSRSQGTSGGGEGPSGGGRLRGAGDRERSSHGRQKRRSSWGLALGTLPQGPDRRTSFTGGEKGKN